MTGRAEKLVAETLLTPLDGPSFGDPITVGFEDHVGTDSKGNVVAVARSARQMTPCRRCGALVMTEHQVIHLRTHKAQENPPTEEALNGI